MRRRKNSLCVDLTRCRHFNKCKPYEEPCRPKKKEKEQWNIKFLMIIVQTKNVNLIPTTQQSSQRINVIIVVNSDAWTVKRKGYRGIENENTNDRWTYISWMWCVWI